MERNVSQQNFVFVGGTGGIGQAAALELARRHAHILVLGRSPERGRRAVQRLQDAGAADASFLAADLTSLEGIDRAAQGIRQWRPALHGLTHSAMAVSMGGRSTTADGFEFAFGLQYLARAALNRALVGALAASGDGRIVHVAADPPASTAVRLDDLQFETRPWSLMASLMSSQLLGFLHAREAVRQWRALPVSIALACVGPTMTESIRGQPWWVRALYAVVATSPERSAQNVVRFLTDEKAHNGVATRKSTRFSPTPVEGDEAQAAKLWELTGAWLQGT